MSGSHDADVDPVDAAIATPGDVLSFWFEALKPAQWWTRDDAVDQAIAARFGATHAAAARGELAAWRATPDGRLAEVIALDQFARNLHRDGAGAFACDGMALVLSQEAIRAGADQALPAARRGFLYMPFMHSESRLIHAESILLFSTPGLEQHLGSARQHQAIIERFGRYPHRNAVLGRASTAEEIEFLKGPGSSF